MDEKAYPFMEHLKDLRKCLWRAMIGVALAMCGSLFFSKQLLAWLQRPMESVLGDFSHFVVLTPHEYFFTEMKAGLVAGIFVASPWILYQLWLFIAPGLYRKEQKLAFGFVFAGAFFFVAGAIFCYLVVFPPMFKFFVGTLPPGVHGNYSIGMLFSFATNMLLAFGLVFETPVVVFLLIWMGIVDIADLQSYRRYVIVMAFIVAAVLTPTPDPLTQVMMAVPMILLYELGLLAARLCLSRKIA